MEEEGDKLARERERERERGMQRDRQREGEREDARSKRYRPRGKEMDDAGVTSLPA